MTRAHSPALSPKIPAVASPARLASRTWRAVWCAGCAAGAVLAQERGEFQRPPPMDLLPVFFPPVPPPLGRPVSRLGATAGGRTPAPTELAAFVNEPFYAPLGTRLARRDLPEKLAGKLAAYRAEKVALQTELRAELDRQREAEPAARGAALEALARRQAPALARLEAAAEELRAQLITEETNWSAHREWRLGASGGRGDSPNEVAQVMRATASYQAGLLPAQRRLLREIALEVAMSEADEAKAAAAQPFLFFPPEPARVAVPDDIALEVANELAAFQTKKSALKKELYDLVHKEDRAAFGFSRTRAFQALAAKQAPRLAELEQLAERIRGGLAGAPGLVPPPPKSPLPHTLTERTLDLRARFGALQAEVGEKLDALAVRLRALNLELRYQFETEGVKTVLFARRGGRGAASDASENPQALRAAVTAAEEDYRARNGALHAELDQLRKEIAAYLGGAAPAKVETALGGVARYGV
ncbi:MAG: hypothetical protein RLZZ15_4215, partial [Verrucomicrobiota bacterium]